MRKVPQEKIEHALDGLLVKVLLEQSDESLREFRDAIQFFQKAGYHVDDYITYHHDLDKDLEKYGWIHH